MHYPCIFHGTLIPGQPLIYVGLYVDDIIYFSSSKQVEKEFETRFCSEIPCVFNGQVDHFLGIKFTNVTHTDGNIFIFMNQITLMEHLLYQYDMSGTEVKTVSTPHFSGYPVDTILQENTIVI